MRKLMFVVAGVGLLLFSSCVAFESASNRRIKIIWRPYIVGSWCVELPDSIGIEERR